MKKLSKLTSNSISLNSIDFNGFSNSKTWVGYFEAINKKPIERIKQSTQLFSDFFQEDLNDFFLLSALADNTYNCHTDFERYLDTEDEDKIYSEIFNLAKEKGFLQKYSEKFNKYLENDERLPLDLVNLHFDSSLFMPFCELVMAYYFNEVAGQVCFLINPKLQIALYPHDDIGFGCISLNSKTDILIDFLEFCEKSEYFSSNINPEYL